MFSLLHLQSGESSNETGKLQNLENKNKNNFQLQHQCNINIPNILIGRDTHFKPSMQDYYGDLKTVVKIPY